MHLELTPEQLHSRGDVLDKIMEVAFDASVIVDENGIIIHRSQGSADLTKIPLVDAIGKSIKELDPQSPFDEVLRTGKANLGLMVVINKRKCMTNIIPVISGQKVIGAIGTVLFQNMTNLKKILSSLNVQVENTKEQKNIYDIFSRIDSNYTFDDFIGESEVVKDLLSYCKRAAKTLHPVLICGETGTGKEIIANAFHSATLDHLFTPFVKINCSAIPKELLESELFGYEKGAFTGALTSKKGKFELASGGAILLDEIGEMELSLQSKLLRVIEEREFEKVGGNVLLPLNARIIASTNQDLLSQVEKGLFRRDLYYRLNTIEIILPPLRGRIEDIPILVNHFINKSDLNLKFSDEAMDVFMHYSWPGNVRELKHIIDRLTFIKSDSVVSGDEAKDILKITEIAVQPPVGSTPVSIEQHEINIIAGALNANLGNISETAKQLGISRATLYNKINKYNLKHEKRFST